MKIGVISEAPTLKTGFGTTCSVLVSALASNGHEVAVFGIGAFGETFNRSSYPAKIWAVGKSSEHTFGYLSDFLTYEKPNALLLNSDIVAVNRWLTLCKAIGWKGPVVAHMVLDGLPINPEYLTSLAELTHIITPTNTGAIYLKRVGISKVTTVPHGVDLEVFRPLPDRKDLKSAAGLSGKFVVGVLGRNAERKQHTRVLLALAELKAAKQADDLVLYLHCQIKDDPALGGWNLLEVAKELDIDDIVLFPDNTFTQLEGVPYVNKQGQLQHPLVRSTVPTIPREFGYVQRINICDLIINAAYCGGFELAIIEAQACAVPLAVTDDNGIMAEVAGDGALLMKPIDIGIWRTGARQYFVSPHTIADVIKQVRANSELRKRLSEKGYANAHSFCWDKLKNAVIAVFGDIELHKN